MTKGECDGRTQRRAAGAGPNRLKPRPVGQSPRSHAPCPRNLRTPRSSSPPGKFRGLGRLMRDHLPPTRPLPTAPASTRPLPTAPAPTALAGTYGQPAPTAPPGSATARRSLRPPGRPADTSCTSKARPETRSRRCGWLLVLIGGGAGTGIAYLSRSNQGSAAGLAASPSAHALTTSQIAAKVDPAVVDIVTNIGEGTGMIVSSNGEIITNNHVVEGASTIKVAVLESGHLYGDGRRDRCDGGRGGLEAERRQRACRQLRSATRRLPPSGAPSWR